MNEISVVVNSDLQNTVFLQIKKGEAQAKDGIEN
jgi:hypothetical protein